MQKPTGKSDGQVIAQLVRDAFLHIAQVIVTSRTPSQPSYLENDTENHHDYHYHASLFHLTIEKFKFVQEETSRWWQAIKTPMVIEIVLEHTDGDGDGEGDGEGGKGGKSYHLLERWKLSFVEGHTVHSEKPTHTTPATVFKRLIIMLRTLYTYVRILPGNSVFRHCSKNRLSHWQLKHRVIMHGHHDHEEVDNVPSGSGSGKDRKPSDDVIDRLDALKAVTGVNQQRNMHNEQEQGQGENMFPIYSGPKCDFVDRTPPTTEAHSFAPIDTSHGHLVLTVTYLSDLSLLPRARVDTVDPSKYVIHDYTANEKEKAGGTGRPRRSSSTASTSTSAHRPPRVPSTGKTGNTGNTQTDASPIPIPIPIPIPRSSSRGGSHPTHTHPYSTSESSTRLTPDSPLPSFGTRGVFAGGAFGVGVGAGAGVVAGTPDKDKEHHEHVHEHEHLKLQLHAPEGHGGHDRDRTVPKAVSPSPPSALSVLMDVSTSAPSPPKHLWKGGFIASPFKSSPAHSSIPIQSSQSRDLIVSGPSLTMPQQQQPQRPHKHRGAGEVTAALPPTAIKVAGGFDNINEGESERTVDREADTGRFIRMLQHAPPLPSHPSLPPIPTTTADSPVHGNGVGAGSGSGSGSGSGETPSVSVAPGNALSHIVMDPTALLAEYKDLLAKLPDPPESSE